MDKQSYDKQSKAQALDAEFNDTTRHIIDVPMTKTPNNMHVIITSPERVRRYQYILPKD